MVPMQCTQLLKLSTVGGSMFYISNIWNLSSNKFDLLFYYGATLCIGVWTCAYFACTIIHTVEIFNGDCKKVLSVAIYNNHLDAYCSYLLKQLNKRNTQKDWKGCYNSVNSSSHCLYICVHPNQPHCQQDT